MDFLLQNLVIFVGIIFFAFLSWRKIEYGVYGIIFLLPIYLLRTEIFGIPTTALELSIYILFIVWLAKNILRDSDIRLKIKIHPNLPFIKERNIINFPPLQRGIKGDFSDENLNLTKEEKTLTIGIFLLLSGAIISTIFSSDIRVSAGILKGWFFDPLLFFIILVSVIKNSDQIEKALKIFSLSGFAVAVISLLYWFGFLSNGVSYDGRLHGIYSSPNYLAMYLAPALVIGIWVFMKSNLFLKRFNIEQCTHPLLISPSRVREGEKRRIESSSRFNLLLEKKRYFWLLPVFVMGMSIYFTYSYAAWFAVFFAIILLFGFMFGTEKKPSFHWKLGFLSIFLILIALFFSQSGTAKLENLKSMAYRSSYTSRLMIWKSAFMIGGDNPIFGIGPGNFQKYYLDYQSKFSEPYLEWAVPEPHNIFLAFWLQTGILGLAGFILILIWFFRAMRIKNFKAYTEAKIHTNPSLQKEGNIINFPPLKRGIKGDLNDKKSNLLIVLTVIMVYVLLHGLIDTTYWKNDLAVIFWLVLGLAVRLK